MGEGTKRSITVRAVWERWMRICFWCGQEVPLTVASREHIIPQAKGGRNTVKNLAIAHKLCNSTRGDVPVLEHLEWRAKNSLPVNADTLKRFKSGVKESQRQLNDQERHAAWNHAMKHAVEALAQAQSDEHHIVTFTYGGKERWDMHEEVMRQLSRIEAAVKRLTIGPAVRVLTKEEVAKRTTVFFAGKLVTVPGTHVDINVDGAKPPHPDPDVRREQEKWKWDEAGAKDGGVMVDFRGRLSGTDVKKSFGE